MHWLNLKCNWLWPFNFCNTIIEECIVRMISCLYLGQLKAQYLLKGSHLLLSPEESCEAHWLREGNWSRVTQLVFMPKGKAQNSVSRFLVQHLNNCTGSLESRITCSMNCTEPWDLLQDYLQMDYLNLENYLTRQSFWWRSPLFCEIYIWLFQGLLSSEPWNVILFERCIVLENNSLYIFKINQ